MGEFSDVAIEIAQEMSGDLREQVTDFSYRTINGDEYSYRGIATDVKSFETDGESVFLTSSKWFCLKHELPIRPEIDDVLIVGTAMHRISRVTPVDNVVGWYLYTNA